MVEEGERGTFRKGFLLQQKERDVCEKTLLLPPCLGTCPCGSTGILREHMADPLRMRWDFLDSL